MGLWKGFCRRDSRGGRCLVWERGRTVRAMGIVVRARVVIIWRFCFVRWTNLEYREMGFGVPEDFDRDRVWLFYGIVG